MEDKSVYWQFSELLLGLPELNWRGVVDQLPLADTQRRQLDLSLLQLEDDDQVAAEHYRVFGLNVFPYFSYFVESCSEGYERRDSELLKIFNGHNFHINSQEYGISPSHIGVLLRFYDHLQKKKISAEEKKEFLYQYLFSWVYHLYFSLKDVKSPFFEQVLSLLIQILYMEWCSLGGGHKFSEKLFKLSEEDGLNFMTDKSTGVVQIAKHFVSPSLSGLYISKHLLQMLSFDIRVPLAFGDRLSMFKSLLLESSKYEKLDELINELEVIVARWKKQVYSMSSEFELIKMEWVAKMNTTMVILNELRKAKNIKEDEIGV
ncbi:MAG: molecular chaperone TorD family protein [Bdellovibrionales bacterium]|nr:molecular chaperone TorD family protein [Bdellovibrionales bacterium]